MVDGETRESVTLQQPLFGEPWRYSSLLRVPEMIPECWEHDGNCVVAQLSAHLSMAAETLEQRALSNTSTCCAIGAMKA